MMPLRVILKPSCADTRFCPSLCCVAEPVIYLATKHTTYAPSKWRLFYLFMRRHYVEECLTRIPTDLAGAVQHHSTMSRYALFHLFRPRGALTQDEPLEVFDTHGAVEQHDSDKAAQPRSSEKNAARRAGQTPCTR